LVTDGEIQRFEVVEVAVCEPAAQEGGHRRLFTVAFHDGEDEERLAHAHWRWLGWRWLDPATGQLRLFPAESFGPLPE
jgi:hypothetical protein